MSKPEAFTDTSLDETRLGKIKLRDRAFKEVTEMIEKSPKDIFKVLSLPCKAWVFEKDLLMHMDHEHKDKILILHTFEYKDAIYAEICEKFLEHETKPEVLKTVRGSLVHWRKQNILCDSIVIIHDYDVLRYLKETKDMFDFMWLDLMCPISSIYTRIQHASDKLMEGGIMILSFTKGREPAGFLKKFNITDRVDFICDILQDMEKIGEQNYMDTCPMINVILKKKTTIQNLEDTAYVGPSTQ